MGKENIIATREGVLVMNIRKNSLIKITAISFLLVIFWSASAFAQPDITGFSGSLIDGSSITITGLSFGATGPTIQVYDNFEGGTNGANIKIGAGSATIGEWTSVTYLTPTAPKYSNAHSLSGSLAFRGDATLESWGDGNGSCTAAYKMGFTTSDIFVSYWYYFPTTSDWPCINGGNCNNKLVWVTGSGTSDDDRTIPTNLPSGKSTPNSWFYPACNDCVGGEPPFSPSLLMSKGKWYRFWAYLHGAGNATDHEELWVASPSSEANLTATRRINRTTQIWNTDFNGFNRVMINGFNRWCNDCAESAPTFDDVYIAIGSGARARVEIGDAATYATSKNLTIATVTSWGDTSITATIRQGSFSNLNNAYLYVIDANGDVNTNGYLLSDGGGGGDTGGNTGSSGGDTSSGGSGCGFVKDNNGKGQGAKVEGVSLILMLIITLAGISLARRTKSINATKEGVLVMEIRKNSLIRITAISILLAIIWSGAVYAQPNITSFSGSLTNKGALTITGSGFGTKATLSPWRWDPIEGISVYSGLSDGDTIPYGATSDTSAYWNENNEGKMKYNTTLSEQRGVSTANVASIGTTNCPTNEDNKKLGTTIPESREKYLTFWIWYDTTFTNENSKVMRLWEGNTGATRFSYVLSWANNNGGTVYKTENGSEPWHVNLPTFTRPVAGEWMRVEVYIKQESIPVTSNDGEVWVTQFIDHTNGTSTKHEYLSGSGQNIDGILPERIRWLTFGFDKNCWEPAPYKNINIRMDDIYIDLTRARVEIGNGSTWASTTHREIQIPSAWSDTSITITLNQGSFSNFNNVYLYVIDANGNVNTNGYLLSDGGSGTGGGSGSGSGSGDASASGGSGCGFVKDDGKGQRARGEGLSFIIMLIISLIVIVVLRRATKINHI